MTAPESELDNAQEPDLAPEDSDVEDNDALEDNDAGDEKKPELSIDVKVDSPSACQRHVTVTISREDIERYYDDAFTELMPKASMPGFRPGRAPRKLVESRFRDDVTDQIKGSLLMDSMGQVTEKHEFSAISEPDLDLEAVEVPAEGPMTFEFDLEVRPEFDLPQWQGLKLERPVHEFTQEDVDARLREALSRYGMLAPQDGAAEHDDYVVVDITCRHDGKLVSEAKEQTVRIRPNLSFRDGNLTEFDKLMDGAKAGDVKTAQVTVSDDAPDESVRGQEIEVSMEVLEVKKLTLPPLDEKFLNRIGGFDSEGDLRDAIKHDLQRQLTYHQQQSVRRQITSLLTESADWELPPELLKRQSQRELDRAIMELRSAGFTDQEIRAQSNILRQNNQASTATALKEHFILERIAEDQELDSEPEDFDREIALIAAQSDESPRSVRARYEKRGLMDALRNQIIERKAVELITGQATFKEVEHIPPRTDSFAVDHALGGEGEPEIPDAKHADAKKLSEPTDHS